MGKMAIEDFKGRLGEAFKAIRKRGILARQNFSCCGGCACAELGESLKASPAKRGAVYYHRQDAQAIEIRGWGADRGKADGVFLGFGARPEQDDRDEAGEAIGKEIVECLEAAGLKVEWDGKIASRIWVDGAAPEAPRDADAELAASWMRIAEGR